MLPFPDSTTVAPKVIAPMNRRVPGEVTEYAPKLSAVGLISITPALTETRPEFVNVIPEIEVVIAVVW